LPLKIEQIHSPAATAPHNPKFKKSLAPCRPVVPQSAWNGTNLLEELLHLLRREGAAALTP
jgi:hypothetical protein